MIKINKDLLRKLPKMDLLIEEEEIKNLIKDFGREQVVCSLRISLDFYRNLILEDRVKKAVEKKEVIKKVKEIINKENKLSLKTVLNCTGIVIHTNLGRSVLSEKAIEHMINMGANYNNLEYDLKTGKRGSRNNHISNIIKKLTGAEDAVIVNNNAAAVMLVLNELAKSSEVIISRGELVEIGGSFRIPEIMEMAGSYLKEVGTTNRTHKFDYERAITEDTKIILKVHSSNFKIIGFTTSVDSKELSLIAKEHNLITVEDLGSGMLLNLDNNILNKEKTVKEVIESGIDIVTFSGDKLLGGPQCGIIVGKKNYIDRIKANPLMRALRVDKLILGALEGTLIEYLNKEDVTKNIPTLRMITESKENLLLRIENLLNLIKNLGEFYKAEVIEDIAYIGGGAMPEEEIETYVVALKCEKYSEVYLEKYLRAYKTPIITRLKKDKVIIDIRTLKDKDFKIIVEALEELKEL